MNDEEISQYIQFQEALYDENINETELMSLVNQARKDIGDSQTFHNLFFACITRPNKISMYLQAMVNFKGDYVRQIMLHNHYPIIHYRALEIGILTKNDIKAVYEGDSELRYFYPELGYPLNESEWGKDWSKLKQQRIIRFGGDIAESIFHDDVGKFQQLTSDASYDFNQTLNIKDRHAGYHDLPIICYAAQVGAINCLKYLLDKGANPSKTAENEWNALDFSIAYNNWDIADILLQKGLNFTNSTIDAAIKYYRNSTLLYLKDSKNMDISCGLFDAVIINNVFAVKTILDSLNSKDVSQRLSIINYKRHDASTPLHWAANADLSVIVQLLIKAGADLNARDIYEMMPIHLAAQNGSTKSLEYLIKVGSNINETASHGIRIIFKKLLFILLSKNVS